MLIEVGKYYRTRSGGEGKVVGVLPHDPTIGRPARFVGSIVGREEWSFVWDYQGRSVVDSHDDLIAPWMAARSYTLSLWRDRHGVFLPAVSGGGVGTPMSLRGSTCVAVKTVTISEGEGMSSDYKPVSQKNVVLKLWVWRKEDGTYGFTQHPSVHFSTGKLVAVKELEFSEGEGLDGL